MSIYKVTKLKAILDVPMTMPKRREKVGISDNTSSFKKSLHKLPISNSIFLVLDVFPWQTVAVFIIKL